MNTYQQKILNLSEESAFYKDSNGDFYRIQYTDYEEGTILLLNEDSGEEFTISVDDVEESDSFYKLTEFKVKDATK